MTTLLFIVCVWLTVVGALLWYLKKQRSIPIYRVLGMVAMGLAMMFYVFFRYIAHQMK